MNRAIYNFLEDPEKNLTANLRRMKRFAEEYPDVNEIRAQAVRNLPWGHIVVLIQKITEHQMRVVSLF